MRVLFVFLSEQLITKREVMGADGPTRREVRTDELAKGHADLPAAWP